MEICKFSQAAPPALFPKMEGPIKRMPRISLPSLPALIEPHGLIIFSGAMIFS